MIHHYQPPGHEERRRRDIEMWLAMRGDSATLTQAARAVGLHLSSAKARVARLDGRILSGWAFGPSPTGDPPWLARLRAAGALAPVFCSNETSFQIFESVGRTEGGSP